MTSDLEHVLAYLLRVNNLPQGEAEYQFHPTRKWRFDRAYPDVKLGIEVEGGMWTKSRHRTGEGYTKDCEKYNQAVLLGWRVLRFTRSMLEDGSAIETIKEALR